MIRFITILGTTGIIGVALYLQSILLLNTDVGIHLDVAAKLRNGARLYDDILVPNLPLQFYLRWPVLWLAGQTGWHPVTAVTAFHLALSFISLMLTAFLYRLALPRKDAMALTLVTAFVLFVLPSVGMPMSGRQNEMGQKEHLIIIFLLPYVTAVYLRIIGQSLPAWLTIIIGTGPALACWLKPHYALVVALCEGWLLWKRRSLKAVMLRPESWSMALGAVALLTFFREDMARYMITLRELLPLYAHDSAASPVQAALRAPMYAMPFIILLIASFSLGAWKHSLVRYYSALLCACALSGTLHGKGFGYYFLPAVSFGFLLLAVLGCLLVRRGIRRHPVTAALFLFVGIWLLASYGPHIPLRKHHALAWRETIMDDLKQALHIHARDKRVLILSSNVAFPFPLVNYLDLTWRHSFYCLWPVMGLELIKLRTAEDEKQTLQEKLAGLEHFIKARMTEDLAQLRPSVLLVGLRENGRFRGGHSVDYIEFFSSYSPFAKEMQKYRRVDTLTLSYTEHARFAVYVRESSPAEEAEE